MTTASFTLDTSGEVRLREPVSPDTIGLVLFEWPDLSPFAQGCVEAIKAYLPVVCRPGGSAVAWKFSDLAPEALEQILQDCDAGMKLYTKARRDDGAHFWRWRQAEGRDHGFPPLTPYLGDDGRVYLREAGQ